MDTDAGTGVDARANTGANAATYLDGPGNTYPD